MARYECERCHTMLNTLDTPHLCTDIRKGYEHEAATLRGIADIYRRAHHANDENAAHVALEILRYVKQRGGH